MGFTRQEVIQRIQAQIDKNIPLVGGGAGTGITAKSAEAGGIDLLIIYNSGRYRMAGRGSLAGLMPYGDANEIVVDMAREVLTVVKNTPVLAGVCGTDPFRNMKLFLKQLMDLGFSGIQNFPTVGLIDGTFRQNLEETNMGYGLEVDMVRTARKMDIFTTPYVFNVAEAEMMAKAGADMIVAHMGLTTKGSIGASTAKTLDDCVKLTQDIHDAAKAINPDVFVIVHGGPVAEPEDAEYVLQRTKGICGFYGASSIERLPTEVGIKNQVLDFKKVRFK